MTQLRCASYFICGGNCLQDTEIWRAWHERAEACGRKTYVNVLTGIEQTNHPFEELGSDEDTQARVAVAIHLLNLAEEGVEVKSSRGLQSTTSEV